MRKVRQVGKSAPTKGRFAFAAKKNPYDYAWQQARLVFLIKHPTCKRCGPAVPSVIVDHIVPHQGDQRLFWDRNNWQALCKKCHDSWKQAQEAQKFRYRG